MSDRNEQDQDRIHELEAQGLSTSDAQGVLEAENLKAFRQGALDAGIPKSVVDGKTSLKDHFSQEYIDFKCNRNQGDEE